MAGETCALCGGAVEEEAVDEERQETVRDRAPHLDEEAEIHAGHCQECGHVSYWTEDDD